MASKWHPAAGDWGIFGSTEGADQARKARTAIQQQMQDIQGRREGLTEYFEGLRGFNQRENELTEALRETELAQGRTAKAGSQQGYLSSLENFLTSSYNIGSESDARVSRANLATANNPQEMFALQQRRRAVEQTADAQRIKDESMGQNLTASDLAFRQKQIGQERADLQLGMEETRSQQQLSDQLFQLREALNQYS
tara:strand:+ start:183 stop:773 length:591 start_codon:yes stop_codon:yes gene_type:complete